MTSLRLCDQGMAEWSNNGDPDDYPPAAEVTPRAMQSRSHLLDLLHSAASGQPTAAPPTSVISSALTSSVVGTVRPRAFAVLRLMTNSYLVGTCTGKSAGFSPFRIRSTYPAAAPN